MTAPTTQPDVVDQLVQQAQRLYSLPAVAMRVLELTNQPRIDAKALKKMKKGGMAKLMRGLKGKLPMGGMGGLPPMR